MSKKKILIIVLSLLLLSLTIIVYYKLMPLLTSLKIEENISDENRTAKIIIKDKNSDLSEEVTITQKCPTPAG